MLRTFLYFAKRNPESKCVEEILVPELGLELKGEQLSGLQEEARTLESFLEEKMAVRIHELQKAGKEIPDIAKEFSQYTNAELTHFLDEGYSVMRIDAMVPVRKKGYGERFLPSIGTMSSIMSAISSGVTAYVASDLALEGTMSPAEDRSLSLALAVCSQLVSLGFYFGADSK